MKTTFSAYSHMVYGNASSALYNTAIILVVGLVFVMVSSLITNWSEE